MCYCVSVFFFNDTATTEIYTLSLHDALPISVSSPRTPPAGPRWRESNRGARPASAACASSTSPPRRTVPSRPSSGARPTPRSEEHTSELQSRQYLVCRLLLEKKNNQQLYYQY